MPETELMAAREAMDITVLLDASALNQDGTIRIMFEGYEAMKL